MNSGSSVRQLTLIKKMALEHGRDVKAKEPYPPSHCLKSNKLMQSVTAIRLERYDKASIAFNRNEDLHMSRAARMLLDEKQSFTVFCTAEFGYDAKEYEKEFAEIVAERFGECGLKVTHHRGVFNAHEEKYYSVVHNPHAKWWWRFSKKHK